MKNIFKDKIILVTGGTGSIGSELVRQLLAYGPKQIRVYSRNENRQAYLVNELEYPQNLRMLIGDVRDYERFNFACRDVDVIFHTAAMKHVPSCEYNPFEAVQTNIIGSQNVIRAALKNGVKKIVAISTDKAANPLSVMGVSKLMMEKLFTQTSLIFDRQTIQSSCVRFGNVAWTEGSVLPLWKRQAEQRGEICVTSQRMTRFMMSISQAIRLTLRAAELSKGGEIFILKMPAARLSDIAKMFVKKHYPDKKIKIVEIGIRPGEKIHEDLIGLSDWARKIFEDKEMFILVSATTILGLKDTPVMYPGFKEVSLTRSYSSKREINLKKILEFI